MKIPFFYSKIEQKRIYKTKGRNMKKKIYQKIGAGFLTVMLLFGNVAYGKANQDNYAEIFEQLMQRIERDYTGEISRQEMFEAAMRGMFGSLDEYSEFFTEEQTKRFEQSINRSFEGIGIQFRKENDKFVVVSLIPGGSAKEGGILVGDILISADGIFFEKMKSTEEVADKILGQKGTKVKLTVQRGNQFLNYELERRTLHLPTVEQIDWATLPNEIRKEVKADETIYISLNSFGENTADDFAEIIRKEENKKAKVLILDLRDNGGGYVSAVIDIANLLVPEGKVVVFKDKQGQEDIYYSDLKKAPFQKVITLVNKNSASASEILAGALKDSGVGLLIGENTFGKGVAQEFLSISGGKYSMKLTYKEFFTPSGKTINKQGIAPHIQMNTPQFIISDRRYYLGDENDAIYQIESILNYLGYLKEAPDRKYESNTMAAVLAFQKASGLGAHKVIDFTTQAALNTALRNSVSKEDKVLLRAIQESRKILLTDK